MKDEAKKLLQENPKLIRSILTEFSNCLNQQGLTLYRMEMGNTIEWFMNHPANKEIQPKDYEILEFAKLSQRDMVRLYKKYGTCFSDCFGGKLFSEENLLKLPDHKIYSVRRLSDNVIFTIGDEVKEGSIRGFFLDKGYNRLFVIFPDKPIDWLLLKHVTKQPAEPEKKEWDNHKNVALKEGPPLGLRPMHIAIKERIEEILCAMARYNDEGKTIPQDWIEELKLHDLNQKSDK